MVAIMILSVKQKITNLNKCYIDMMSQIKGNASVLASLWP